MSDPSTPRTPRTPRRQSGRLSQTPQNRDGPSSELPSSPGLHYPSSPGIGASSPLPFPTSPGLQIQYQPGQYAQPLGRAARMLGSEDVSSPMGLGLPSSPHPRSSNLRSDISYATNREPRSTVSEVRRRRNDVVSNAQVARHLATRGDGVSEVAPSTNFPTSQDYDPAQVVKVVWGTAVEIDEVIRIFRDFLDNFKQKHRIVKENPNVQTITE
ncbi:hypothetical protein BGX34_003337, partial [Mortierella sp. NVP85]